MAGIELVADRESKRPFPPEKKTGIRVIREARNRGVIIRPLGDVMVIMPPLSIALEHLEALLTIMFDSIERVTTSERE